MTPVAKQVGGSMQLPVKDLKGLDATSPSV